jgi:hypothetical protein
MSVGWAPSPSSVSTAARPLVPYPTTTVWLRTRLLQRWTRNDCRDDSVSSSTVVPTKVIRKIRRSGVTKIVVIVRAVGETGTMSP